MHIINARRHSLSFSFHALVTLALVLTQTCVVALKLNITAIGAHRRLSVLECWQMDTPFTISTDAGVAGSASVQLGNVSQVTYTVLPAGFDGGLHNAPKNQWVAFTTGLAVITLPGNNSPLATASVVGGQFGLIFAADTAQVSDRGHITRYPGISETIALQIPTYDGKVPKHDVLHPGPCTAKDVVGLLGLATGSV